METIGSYEAKTHFPRLLRKVEKGKTYSITRKGVPVAKLSPLNDTETKITSREAAKKMGEFSQKYQFRLEGMTIKDLINEGRRY